MVGGAYRAVLETDLKRVLAYSTISALGVLMLLLGIGTREAVIASLHVFLLAHACYKGALFLVAGAVEHETGTRDVTALGGLRRRMPMTAAAGALAAASMAGVPLFVGFVAKEQFLRQRPAFRGLRRTGRRLRPRGRRRERLPRRGRIDRPACRRSSDGRRRRRQHARGPAVTVAGTARARESWASSSGSRRRCSTRR